MKRRKKWSCCRACWMSWYRSYECSSTKYVVEKERKEERGWEERKALFCLRWHGASNKRSLTGSGARARARGQISREGGLPWVCAGISGGGKGKGRWSEKGGFFGSERKSLSVEWFLEFGIWNSREYSTRVIHAYLHPFCFA